jgi:hypothetical protein
MASMIHAWRGTATVLAPVVLAAGTAVDGVLMSVLALLAVRRRDLLWGAESAPSMSIPSFCRGLPR